MSVFPLTKEVTRRRSGPDGVDAHGNVVHGPPVEEQILVFAWWVGTSGEPNVSGHVERVESDGSMITAPGEFLPGDQVSLPGQGVFDVDGHPANYDNNPWWSPEVEMVQLRRVEG